jgi:transposase InsO family protein
VDQKGKILPKTASQAQFRGQRLHLDLSGPYSSTVTGEIYWVKIKDSYSKMSWNIFCKAKYLVPSILGQKLHQLKALHIPVKFLRCANAGEHGDRLRQVCERHGVKIEYTAPYTPQQNGTIERQFYTDLTRANAMLEAAHFKPETKRWLLFEAIKVATTSYNICSSSANSKSPYELFYGFAPHTPYHMIEFGRVGYHK